ncbi:hypothetical protein KKA14_05415 [bacterium]|nr:hypothetical protein [bacterium]
MGREIQRIIDNSESSWYSIRLGDSVTPEIESLQTIIRFDWDDSTTWTNIPDKAVRLVLTIPPVLKDRDREKMRVKAWCRWMNKNRGEYKNLVYISSTGVYPNQAGYWDEYSDVKPDTLKGFQRLDTETILGEHFKLRVIRAGAIYGEKRNIGERILNGKTIPSGDHPVHRIHVCDLARIVKLALMEESFPSIVNAVDLDADSSEQVANWLVGQDYFQISPDNKINFSKGYVSRKFKTQQPKREISNHCLLKQCEYDFLYPTYREGLKQIFGP